MIPELKNQTQKTWLYLDNALIRLLQTLYKKREKSFICSEEQYPTDYSIFVII